MKIEVEENNAIVLKEVYNGIVLKTNDNDEFGICMRDSGFEFRYNGIWYEAKEGVVKPLKN